MQCPYCLGELDPTAVACRFCGHDLAGLAYLLRRLADLQSAVDALQMRAEGSVAPSGASGSVADGRPPVSVTPELFGAGAADILRFVVVPDLLLVIAHHLLVLSWNVGPIWLFLATLLLPVPFGFRALIVGSRGLVFWVLVYLVNAVSVVFAMNLDTALSALDGFTGSSVVPANRMEWLQNFQFAAGLWLSFAAGLFTSLIALRGRDPAHPKVLASRLGVELFVHRFQLALSAASIERAARYVGSVGAIASAVGALYLGLQRL
jgi:hypothetical protein